MITMLENRSTLRNFPVRLSAMIVGLLSLDAKSAASKEIPVAKSLQAEISLALKTSSPLLVFVSLDNCPFCKIARENYLLPLMNEQLIPIVQVNFRYPASVIDSRGQVLTQDQLIRAWGVKVAPTVLFLGKEGKEVAPRLTGGSTSDFYGVYLDERVRIAQSAIQNDAIKK
jgi:thioredoxin-related protein